MQTTAPIQSTDTDSNPATATGSVARPTRDGVSFGIAFVLVGVAGVMLTYGEFFVDAAVISLVLAGLAIWATRTQSRRLRVGIAVLLAIFVAINLVYSVGDLSHPESSAAFLSTAIVIGGSLVTIVLAVLSARSRPAAARRVWMVSGGVFVLLAIGSVVAAAAVEDDDRLPGDVEIVAEDNSFPDQVAVAGDATGLFVRNADRYRHTLVIDDQIDPVELPANSDVRIAMELAPGTYTYYCDITGHESMKGTLVVD